MGQAYLRDHEGAANVHSMDQIKSLHRRIQGAGQEDRAGVIDHDVDAAEVLDRFRDGCSYLILEANVGWDCQSSAPGSLNLCDGCMDRAWQSRMWLDRLSGNDHIRSVAAGAQR